MKSFKQFIKEDYFNFSNVMILEAGLLFYDKDNPETILANTHYFDDNVDKHQAKLLSYKKAIENAKKIGVKKIGIIPTDHPHMFGAFNNQKWSIVNGKAVHAYVNPLSDNSNSHIPQKEQEQEKSRKYHEEKVRGLNDRLINYYNKFTNEDKTAIKEYSDGSSSLNRYLIDRAGLTSRTAKTNSSGSGRYYDQINAHSFNKKEKRLQAALQKHKTPEDITVTTGMRVSPEHQLPEFRKERGKSLVVLPAFTSTSLEYHTAYGFTRPDPWNSNHIYHQGTPLSREDREFYRKHASSYDSTSAYNSEKEVNGEAYSHILHIHIPKGSHGAYIPKHSSYSHEKEFLMHNDAVLKLNHTPQINHKRKRVHWHAHLVHDGVNFTKHWDGKPY
jgi:hypothetical protein